VRIVQAIMALQNIKQTDDVKYLMARGKSGILTQFKLSAEASRNKSLRRTQEDSDRVNSLIKEYDSLEKHIKTQRLLDRKKLENNHLKVVYRLIKIAVIRQGFISSSTLARFKFIPADLIEKITYRNLIEKFLIDNLFGEQQEVIKPAIIEESQKGEAIDINVMSDEFIELNSDLKWLTGSGELTKAEEGAGWLKWSQIKNRDKSAIYKKQAKIQNLCYYILSQSTSDPNRIIIDRKKLLSLSTSNLERIITFYCKKMNAYNGKVIESLRKSDKRLKTNSKYIHRKPSTANEKRERIKDLKIEGKTQSEIAKEIGCSERTVRSYWK
jgi:hypothetical protein